MSQFWDRFNTGFAYWAGAVVADLVFAILFTTAVIAICAAAAFVVTQDDTPEGQKRAAQIVAEAFPNIVEK